VSFRTIAGSFACATSKFGKLKNNELGLAEGIYKPDLPVRRLIPPTVLNSTGFKVELDDPGFGLSCIKSHTSSFRKTLNNDGVTLSSLSLPTLSDGLKFGSKIHRDIDQFYDECVVCPEEGRDVSSLKKARFSSLDRFQSSFLSQLDLHRGRDHIDSHFGARMQDQMSRMRFGQRTQGYSFQGT
jgi:hypothetical protein